MKPIRYLILIAVTLFLAQPASAVIARAQGNSGDNPSVTTATATLNGTVSGNALRLLVCWYNTTATLTTPTGFTIKTATFSQGSVISCESFCQNSIVGGNISATLTFSVGNNGDAWMIDEISGQTTTGSGPCNMSDVGNSNGAASGTTLTSGAWTTTNANELVLSGGAALNTGLTFSLGAIAGSTTGVTLRVNTSNANASYAEEDRVLSSTASATTANIGVSVESGGYVIITDTFVAGTGCRNRIALLGAGCS